MANNLLSSIWSDARISNALVEMFNDGLSASAIAGNLTVGFGLRVTRNMVIGRSHRMGLKRDETKKEARPKRERLIRIRAPRPVVAEPKIKPEKFIPNVADVNSLRLTILEVGHMQCRWADEDRNSDGLHTFCGNPTDDGKSYCAAHMALNIGAGTASERHAVEGVRSMA